MKENQGRCDYLTKEEIKKLLDSNVGEEGYHVISMAVNTGMRIGEICGLCWDRIDFERGQIEVSRSFSRTEIQERTKTNLIRYIGMNGPVRDMLTELKKRRGFSPFVFVKRNGLPFTADHFSQRFFAPALERAGVKKITFHVLRHTFASHFMMRKGEIYLLQKILGHTSIVMTQRYAHLNPEYLKEAAEIVSFDTLRPKVAPEVNQHFDLKSISAG